MAAMDTLNAYPESPMDHDDIVYPCKGCGDILEEGKAFELAGNRWHIDCFRCNTCDTLLDSDANLLLLGDGSLICNNCTYSCSACGNQIEDLAILTGDQAFCSGCFRCRNCKRKIENLRYARTSQGIFCMSCHESLMARRRKKAKQAQSSSGSTPAAEKALPSLPPSAISESAMTPDGETSPEYADSRGTPQQSRSPRDGHLSPRPGASPNNFKRDVSPLSDDARRDGPTLPASTYSDGRPSNVSSNMDDDDGPERGFLPMAFDPTPIQPGQPPSITRKQVPRTQEPSPPSQKENLSRRDYFGTNGRLAAPKQQQQRDQQTRDGLTREEWPNSGSSRDVSAEREPQPPSSQPKPSPHIYYQEKGRSRKRETSGANTPANGSTTASPVVGNTLDRGAPKLKSPPLAADPGTLAQGPQDGFKLQQVPRAAKERSRANSGQATQSPMVVSPIENREGKISQPVSPVSVNSQNSGVNPFDDPKRKNASQSNETPIAPKPADKNLPLRADSLNAAAHNARTAPSDPSTPTTAPSFVSTQSSTASTLVQSQSSSHERQASTSSVPSTFTDAKSTLSRDGSRSRPEPSTVRSSFDAPLPPRSANRPSAPSKSVANDDFIAPRHAPPPPPVGNKSNAPASTSQSAEGRRSIDGQLTSGLHSAGLPKYNLDGGFSMDDEMVRIMRGEQSQSKEGGRSSPSVLRRVSNAVKHGRSFSDRAATGSKTPLNGSHPELSSPAPTPSITSPTSADGPDLLRASLRRAQLHIAELETEKLRLQEQLDGSSEIKAVNTELHEKRSTMAFLDTQREMVVRELEIMTDHLNKAKDSSQPLDLGSLKTSILKDFAESLQKLKGNMGAQIEELMHKRNELTDEIGNLIQMKDKGFQEYENLSSKNSQLMQHNNELLRSIQGVYQDNRTTNGGTANGLGIYHSGAKTETSGTSEARKLNVVNTDLSMQNLLQDPDAETPTVVTAPQVVNIRKGGKPNKFNWRRGGEKITGKVTKGIKGFVGTGVQQTQGQQYSIGHPYNATTPATSQATAGSEQSGIHNKGMEDGKSGAGYGFFSQKNGGTKAGGLGHVKDDSSANLVAPSDPSILFGSELGARCNFEGRVIPSVVLRCIQEVEKRGLDQEGIYRKSGGAGQVKTVQQGFEGDQDYDISDPDLDIHAVTSALKQYFRKLPTPLIQYDAYDSLLEAGQVQDKEKQAVALRMAVHELPEVHRECLAYLIRHLCLVMSYESKNLMTPLNLAVVFAPTIMRPLSIEREMSDMQVQRTAVQALLEQRKAIFDD